MKTNKPSNVRASTFAALSVNSAKQHMQPMVRRYVVLRTTSKTHHRAFPSALPQGKCGAVQVSATRHREIASSHACPPTPLRFGDQSGGRCQGKSLLTMTVLVLLLAACSSTPAPTAATSASSSGLTEVSVVMGYIPHVQFAPWYVADKKGYFSSAGIKIKYNWGFELDGIRLVGANQADFAMLGGDQVIQALGQDIPLVYVANYYNSFPISIFSLKEKNITSPKDLVGKKVGLPGFYGATYTGWRAMLYAAGIRESDVQTQDIGFTQVAAVTQGIVDAAAGYSNNEPVQLMLAGKEINVIPVSEYSKLVGIGLVTNEKLLAEKPQLVQKMVGALVHGIQDTISNPDEALTLTLENLPEAGGQNLKTSQAVLNASIKLMKNSQLGFVDPANWTASYKFMKEAGLVKTDFDVTKAYTNNLIQ